MGSKFEHYNEYVEEGAKSFVDEHLEEAFTEVLDGDTNMQQFIDDYRLHEWVDNDFIYHDLMDSAQILDQSDNVEGDSGLWEGQDPRDAIKTQAFFTFRTDMYLKIKEIFEEKLTEKKEELEEELEKLEEDVKTLEVDIEEKEEKLNSMVVEDDGYDELEEKITVLSTRLETFEEKVAELDEQISFFDTAIDDL